MLPTNTHIFLIFHSLSLVSIPFSNSTFRKTQVRIFSLLWSDDSRKLYFLNCSGTLARIRCNLMCCSCLYGNNPLLFRIQQMINESGRFCSCADMIFWSASFNKQYYIYPTEIWFIAFFLMYSHFVSACFTFLSSRASSFW